MPHIESKLTLFEVVVKHMFVNAPEARKAHLAQPPKVLNSVDVIGALSRLVVTMFDALMPFVSKISQTIVGSEAIAIKHHVALGFLPDNRQYFSRRAAFDDLCIDLAGAPEHAKHRHLASGTPSALATHPAGAEVAFVQFNRPLIKGAEAFAFAGDVLSDFVKDLVHGLAAKADNLSDFAGFDIEAKQAQDMPEFRLGNSRTKDILVFHLYNNELHLF